MGKFSSRLALEFEADSQKEVEDVLLIIASLKVKSVSVVPGTLRLLSIQQQVDKRRKLLKIKNRK